MRTYNFCYITKEGLWEQVEINAESKNDAWRQFHNLALNVIYVDLLS